MLIKYFELCFFTVLGVTLIIGIWLGIFWKRQDGKTEIEKKRCRMCGTTEHPCITYDKDMLCRKCFDDVIPYATREKTEKPNDYQIRDKEGELIMKKPTIKQTLETLKTEGRIYNYTYEEHWEFDPSGIWVGLFLIISGSLFILFLRPLSADWIFTIQIILGFPFTIGGFLTMVHRRKNKKSDEIKRGN